MFTHNKVQIFYITYSNQTVGELPQIGSTNNYDFINNDTLGTDCRFNPGFYYFGAIIANGNCGSLQLNQSDSKFLLIK
jgi:hypothetical protein